MVVLWLEHSLLVYCLGVSLVLYNQKSNVEKWKYLEQLEAEIKEEKQRLRIEIISSEDDDFVITEKVKNMRSWGVSTEEVQATVRDYEGLEEFCIHEPKEKSVAVVEKELTKAGYNPDMRKDILNQVIRVKQIRSIEIVPK